MSETLRIPSQFNGPLESGNGGLLGSDSRLRRGNGGGQPEGSGTARQATPCDPRRRRVRTRSRRRDVRGRGASGARARPRGTSSSGPPRGTLGGGALQGIARRRFQSLLRLRAGTGGCFRGVRGSGRGPAGRRVAVDPPSWTADATGSVLPEFVWAVLDCPTYFATYMEQELAPGVLARLAARIDAPVVAGEEYAVIAWPIETDGRKRHAGSAVLSRDGKALAVARALLIEPRAG